MCRLALIQVHAGPAPVSNQCPNALWTVQHFGSNGQRGMWLRNAHEDPTHMKHMHGTAASGRLVFLVVPRPHRAYTMGVLQCTSGPQHPRLGGVQAKRFSVSGGGEQFEFPVRFHCLQQVHLAENCPKQCTTKGPGSWLILPPDSPLTGPHSNRCCMTPHGGRTACRARAVHKVCTGLYPSCIVVPSTSNNEPCYASI